MMSFRNGVRTVRRQFVTASSSPLLESATTSVVLRGKVARMYSSGVSPAKMSGVHTADIKYTKNFKYIGDNGKPLEAFRVMDLQGTIVNPDHDPGLGQELVEKMYTSMVQLHQMDETLYKLQRQGEISFYMTATGEYATHIGSAAALSADDMVYAQYREQGVLMWRGFSLEQICNQCFSNDLDLGKGRQMPVHYGSRELNYQTISSPLSTQIPQAAGAAYAQRLMGKDALTVCYFGDGAASEGDFHAALNFASTLDSPTLFFCRNNRYAISTPVRDQYRGDGIAARGPGYGIKTIRIDGNDIFAVYQTVQRARKEALETSRPILIEAMTYRVGHHSTSDDYTRYRDQGEVDAWTAANCPVQRLRLYMEAKGWWTEDQETTLRQQVVKDVMTAFKAAEARPKPPLTELFTDVYDKVLPHLETQQQELLDHIAKYPEEYPTGNYKQ